MRKISSYMNGIILTLFAVFMSWGLLNLLIGSLMFDVCTQKSFPIYNFAYFGIAIILIGIASIFINKYKDTIEHQVSKREKLVLAAIIVVYFFTQCMFFFSVYFYAGWDAGVVWDTVIYELNNRYDLINNVYFSVYSNNLFIVWVYKTIVGFVCGLFNIRAEFVVLIFQILLNCFVVRILYSVARRLAKSVVGALGVVAIYLLWAGYSPWFIVTYTDQLAIIFPILILFMYLKFKESSDIKVRALLLFIIGFTSCMGYLLKPQVIVMSIAILLNVLFNQLKDKSKVKCFLGAIALVVLGYISMFALFKSCIVPSLNIELDSELRFGVSHYLMMGLNDETDGVFSEDDLDISISYLNKSQRNAANMEVVSKRINNYGVFGMINHLNRKMLVNYGDGTFAWFEEGDFLRGIPEWNAEDFDNYLWIIPGADKYNVFISALQIMWLLVLMLSLVAVFSSDKGDIEYILMLSIVGITLFVLIFEARARYLFIYAPIWSLLSIKGLGFIAKKAKK